jgi:hypothetical protein
MIDPQHADIGRVVVHRPSGGPVGVGIIVAIEPGHVLVQFDTPPQPQRISCDDLIFDRRSYARAAPELTPVEMKARADREALMARLRATIAARKKATPPQ